MRFPRSKLYISALVPIGIGFVGGILAAILGIGGGFLLVPAMIYILGMSTQVVIGTSLMQVLFVSIVSTIMHSQVNQTVDVILSGFLLFGGVFGVQAGALIVQKISGEIIRMLLGILIFSLCVFLFSNLLIDPSLLYVVEFLR